MRVFLSYSDRDRAVAVRLHEGLRHRRPDLDLYLAPVRNRLGAYWIPRLAEELAAADAVLLLMGDRVGTWQELEYAEAVRLNRNTRRPLIAPILLGDAVPGLPFIDQFHRLVFDPSVFDHVLDGILAALDGSVAPDAAPLWRLTNPYRGLPAMRSEDAAYFFGREAITAEILDTLRLKPDRIIALVGNSGVGKSSIAQAGVLAALRSRLWPGDPDRAWPAALADSPAWLPVTIIPGERPLKALALGFARTWLDDPADAEAQAMKWVDLLAAASDLAALADAARSQVAERTAADPPPRVLLYVDQAEELYARAEPGEAEAVSRLLADAVRRPEILVLSSLRSDYYGRFQNDGPLFAASDRLDVPPLGREQIDRVIRGPAARLGVRFDRPEIVPLIAQATARAPGSMPMLSYLMADAWEAMRRDQASGGVLSFAYEIVDISRPLADRADRFLDQHPDSEVALRRLFTLKLTHMPKEGEPVRRRAGRQDCTAEEWSLAEQLAGPDWRLLSTGQEGGEAVVEVAHEALLRNWPRLALWLDSAREFLIWKGQLEADRREWEAATNADKPRALLTGLRLDAARFWLAERGEDLGEVDRAFVRASCQAYDESEFERLETRRRIMRRTRHGAIVACALSIIAIGFALNGEMERQRAENALEVAKHERTRTEDALLDAETERQRAESALATSQQQQIRTELALETADSERARAEQQLRRAQIEQARYRASVAIDLVRAGDASAAVAMALSAMPQANPDGWPNLADIPEVPTAIYGALIARRELAVLRGHAAPVRAATFTPDGAHVVTASDDATGRVWDPETGTAIAILLGHESGIGSATCSPDGSIVATASSDGSARLWDAVTGIEIMSLLGHTDRVTSVAFSPDGRSVVTASWDGTARLWETATGAQMAILRGHQGHVSSASFSPDGRMILTSSFDDTARLWNAATGEEVAALVGHSDVVRYAEFSQDGKRVVTASWDGTARIWNGITGVENAVLRGHTEQLFSARFSPDGTQVVTAAHDRTAILWDTVSGEQITTLRGHRGWVTSASFSADGTQILTTSSDETARLWDAATGRETAVLRSHERMLWSAAFSPDGNQVVTTSLDGTARVWRIDSTAETYELRGHSEPITSANFSPDGRQFTTTSFDDTAMVWDLERRTNVSVFRGHRSAVLSAIFLPNAENIMTFSLDGTVRIWESSSGAEISILGDRNRMSQFAVLSPDGKRLVSGDVRNFARVWEVESAEIVSVLSGHEDSIRSAAFSPDGTHIVTASWDETARVWNTSTGMQTAILIGHQDWVVSAAYSPSGARIVTGSQDGTARIWDAATGEVLFVLEGHSPRVSFAAFSPSGDRILTISSTDDTARVWDAESGIEMVVFHQHDGGIAGATFSPDGSRIVTIADDDTARLWDTETGNEIAILRHEAAVRAAAFSPDGQSIVTASRDGMVKIWPHYQTVDELYEHAQAIVYELDPLTTSERCAYHLTSEGCN